MALVDVFNRYLTNASKRYRGIVYRGRQHVETAEWNEAGSIERAERKDIGDMAVGPISLREGGEILIDELAGTVRISASRVWAGGHIHQVAERILTNVPMIGTVAIGVSVTESTITHIEDPELKGVVPNTASFGKALGGRLFYDAVWATDGDPFYPIFTIIDGQLPTLPTAPVDFAAELAVERHNRETHGSHIVDGFQVSPGGFNVVTGEQTYIISAGVLIAFGRRVARNVDQRFRRVENPTLVQVNGENHAYPVGGIVTLNNGPIDSVQTAIVVKEVVRTVTHQLVGGTDALPDTPVFAILAVNAGGAWNAGTRTFTGGTNYAENTSWVKSGDGISWAPAGAEPSAGTTVTIVYRYSATVAPQAVGRNTLTLEAAVVGQPVIVNYRYKLPRVDVLAIDLDGSVVYLEGLSTKYNPIAPTVPAPLAPLCRISNQWGIDPLIEDVDQRKLTEADGRALLRTVLDMFDLISQVSLERDVQERDPASRRGSFVDPFVSDDQRDLGLAQTASIFDGILELPVTFTPMFVDVGNVAITLPYVTEPIISQPFRTLSQKINEFLAFAPLPTPLTINPAVDRWNEVQTSTISTSSSSTKRVSSYRPDLVGTKAYGTSSSKSSSSTSTSLQSRTVTNLEFLRPITVAFEISRWGPGEIFDKLTFDGVDVSASVTGPKVANAQGIMTGTFAIPAGIRAGTKEVMVQGKGGSRGFTSFVGQGTLTVEVWRKSTHTSTTITTIDPVAQSFVLDSPRQITGARVEFTARGNPAKDVVLEMRTMEGSQPSTETVAEGRIPGTFALGNPNVVALANWSEINFSFPTLVQAGDWHAIALLTDDPNHSVAIAELGSQTGDSPRGFDPRRQEWIRSNPAGGDFFKGSNGKSWLVLPDTDLTCEIMAARYTSLSRTFVIGTFNLGTINAGGISDIVVLLIVEEPSPETKVKLEMVLASGEVIPFEPNAPLRLDQYLTEEVIIRMVLTGTATLSPMVSPECQILWGHLEATANYISEANVVDLTAGNVKVRTVLEVNSPGTSSVAVATGNPGSFVNQTGPLAVALGDGWIEREYLQSPYTAAEARTQIVLAGTPKDRPLVRKLRVRATEV